MNDREKDILTSKPDFKRTMDTLLLFDSSLVNDIYKTYYGEEELKKKLKEYKKGDGK